MPTKTTIKRTILRNEERKDNDEDYNDDTTHVCWQASANVVKGANLFMSTRFEDAISGQDQVHWRKTSCAELNSMKLRGVFRARKVPVEQHTIGTKWLLKLNRKTDGSIVKLKAHLVAKGFKEKCVINYMESISPMVRYVTQDMVIPLTKCFD